MDPFEIQLYRKRYSGPCQLHYNGDLHPIFIGRKLICSCEGPWKSARCSLSLQSAALWPSAPPATRGKSLEGAGPKPLVAKGFRALTALACLFLSMDRSSWTDRPTGRCLMPAVHRASSAGNPRHVARPGCSVWAESAGPPAPAAFAAPRPPIIAAAVDRSVWRGFAPRQARSARTASTARPGSSANPRWGAVCPSPRGQSAS